MTGKRPVSVSGALALLVVLLIAGLPSAAGAATAATTPLSRPPSLAAVGRSLLTDPLYVSTAPGTPAVSAGDLRGALPSDVYVAVLPLSAAREVNGETAALPGVLLGQLARPCTVLVLAGPALEGASTTQRADRLAEVLADGRARLQAGGPPTPALVLTARSLAGSGQLSDAPSSPRAGSPGGAGALYLVLTLLVIAAITVPLVLRRGRRRSPGRPPPVRDRVEVDAYGRVVRRITAQEQRAQAEQPEDPR